MKIFYYLSIGFDIQGPSWHLMYAKVLKSLEAGYDVFVLCQKSTHGDPHIPEEFIKFPNFKYAAVYIAQPKKSQFALRYLASLKCAWDSRKYLKLARDYDVMFVESNVTMPFDICLAKYYGRIPRVWNIQDMFPGSSIASGVMRKKWMQKFFYALEKVAYRNADHITVISEDMKKSVVEQGVVPEKIDVILNWYNDRIIREVPWEENRFVKKYNLSKDIFYVQYAGTTGYVFDYKAFLHISDALKYEPKIRIQIIAHGSQYDQFKGEAEAMGLTNIDFLPLQPQEMVSDVYSACSVCYIPLKPGVIWNSVPSKAGLLMACKRPVINSVDPESYYFKEFNENKIGISASNLDYQASVDAILYLYNHQEEAKEIGQRAYEYGKRVYASTPNLDKYREVYEKVIANKNSNNQ